MDQEVAGSSPVGLPRGRGTEQSYVPWLSGAVAQLGERLNGIQEVRGSSPLSSIRDRRDESIEERRAGVAQW